MSAICRSLFPPSQVRLYHTRPKSKFLAECVIASSGIPKRRISHNSKGRLPFDLSLYLVADRQSVKDERQFFSNILESVKGGVSCVQLRDQKSDIPTTLKTAIQLKKILRDFRVPLMINTPHLIEVAQAVNAEGVYLEQKFSHSEARRLLGQRMIIGIPVKTMDEVLTAEQSDEIDYISVKIFPSKRTNPGDEEVWGIEGLRKIRSLSQRRVVAIGGIHLENADSVFRALNFDDGIAMAGDLLRGDDPCATAQKIQTLRKIALEI
jgi:thiamine-phosphate pyrophosphorylase